MLRGSGLETAKYRHVKIEHSMQPKSFLTADVLASAREVVKLYHLSGCPHEEDCAGTLSLRRTPQLVRPGDYVMFKDTRKALREHSHQLVGARAEPVFSSCHRLYRLRAGSEYDGKSRVLLMSVQHLFVPTTESMTTIVGLGSSYSRKIKKTLVKIRHMSK